ncbi:hypothetical protein [Streptomyces sp. XH2]|uniref:hypothetical protein n=1 Tax=Streptomyces sp. XH2 TaxID=3412483 RepID=UPI003C7D7D7D
MPRKQPRPAQRARAIQRQAGGKYTALLRHTTAAMTAATPPVAGDGTVAKSPAHDLARALHAAGAVDAAAELEAALAWGAECDRLDQTFEAAEQQRYAAYDNGLARTHCARVEAAAREAGDALMDFVDGDYHRHSRTELHAAAQAMALVAGGRAAPALARQAARVIAQFEDDAESAADAIRGDHAVLLPPLDGPDTMPATAARAVAVALQEAAAIPWRGDEEWTACAELLAKTFRLIRSSAVLWGAGAASLLQIRLGRKRPAPTGDLLGRTVIGWHPGMTETEAWEAGRGIWRLNAARALARDEVQIIAPDQTVLAVARITGITRHGDRHALQGRLLSGDARVSKPTPTPHPSRNPIAYR